MPDSNAFFRFNDFCLIPTTRELFAGDELVAVPPRAFDCLAYLAEHNERAVGKDELISAVWGRMDVSDDLLGHTIMQARRAVEDDGTAQAVLRTIPRFGYRFVAELASEESASSLTIATVVDNAQADSTATEAASRHRPGRNSRVVFIALLILVACVAGALFLLDDRSPTETTQASPNRVPATPVPGLIVLPIEVEGETNAWVRLGGMDYLGSLLREAGLSVPSSETTLSLIHALGADVTPGKILKASQARAVVITRLTPQGFGWNAHIEVLGIDSRKPVVDAEGKDVLSAMRAAEAILLPLLDRKPTQAVGDPSELLQRVKAAMLADDVEQARSLLESAGGADAKDPHVVIAYARLDARAGRLSQAAATLATLHRRVEPTGDTHLLALIENGQGWTALASDHYEDAEYFFRSALTNLGKNAEPSALGDFTSGLAAALASRGLFDEASAQFAIAREAIEKSGDGLMLARLEANLAVLETRRNQYTGALKGFERAASLFARYGSIRERMMLLGDATQADLVLLKNHDALAISDQTWGELVHSANPVLKFQLSLTRAKVLLALGRLSEADELLTLLSGVGEISGQRVMLGEASMLNAQRASEKGELAKAASLVDQAVTGLSGSDHYRELCDAWVLRFDVAQALNRKSSTNDEQAARAAAGDATDVLAICSQLLDAQTRWSAGDSAKATTIFEGALTRAEKSGVPRDIAMVAGRFAARLIESGKLDQAAQVLDSLVGVADEDYKTQLLRLRLAHTQGNVGAWRSALKSAKALAGERAIPDPLAQPPEQ